MLKEQAKLLTNIAKIADLLAVLCAFTLAYHIRRGWHVGTSLDKIDKYLWIMLVVIPTWYFLLSRRNLYESLRTIPLTRVMVNLLNVHIIGGVVTAAVIYSIEPKGFSRGLFSMFLLFSYLLLAIGKISLKMALGYARRKGFNYRNILIVGTADKSRNFIELLDQHANWGLRIVGTLHPQEEQPSADKHGRNLFFGLDNLTEICKVCQVDEVVFCLPREFQLNVDDYIRDLEEMGITVRMVLDIYDVHRARRELSFFHDQVPILTFYSKAFNASQLFLKRCLDVVGAVVGLTITFLLLPVIACAIKWDSPGPLLFGQNRVRESGRIFKCWKFRSMYIDAEERKEELMRLNEMNGAMFKIKDDPRITKVGKFLRKTSLDELPQFWNVLKGEMSLVGTRPPTPGEVATYENWHRKRICIKPGITGLWQISGRNQIQDFDDVVRLDLQYIDQWSLWLDIKILLKTVWVVFVREGAS